MKTTIARLPLCIVLAGALSAGCEHYRTYVMFAGDAKTDKDAERVPSVRLPLWDQVPGATIFCQSGNRRTTATRVDDARVRLRKLDGSIEILEVPDGEPIGLTTRWPVGAAPSRCGLDPSTPLGSYAFAQWGDVVVEMKRVAPEVVIYRVAEENVLMHFPLTEADRQTLHQRAVPKEIVQLLY